MNPRARSSGTPPRPRRPSRSTRRRCASPPERSPARRSTSATSTSPSAICRAAMRPLRWWRSTVFRCRSRRRCCWSPSRASRTRAMKWNAERTGPHLVGTRPGRGRVRAAHGHASPGRSCAPSGSIRRAAIAARARRHGRGWRRQWTLGPAPRSRAVALVSAAPLASGKSRRSQFFETQLASSAAIPRVRRLVRELLLPTAMRRTSLCLLVGSGPRVRDQLRLRHRRRLGDRRIRRERGGGHRRQRVRPEEAGAAAQRRQHGGSSDGRRRRHRRQRWAGRRRRGARAAQAGHAVRRRGRARVRRRRAGTRPAAAAVTRPADAAGGGAGSGGHAGGGGTATGGHGGGGQGGQSVDSGVTCAELANEYSAALPAAEACTPGAANQCQQLVPLTLSICSQLPALRHRRDDA